MDFESVLFGSGSAPCMRQREVTIRKSDRPTICPVNVVFDHFHEAAAMWPLSDQSVTRSADDDVFGKLDSQVAGESRESFRRRDIRFAWGRITTGMIVHKHRSEEHTSELQSLMRISYAVFCLKKKITTQNINTP